MAGCIGIQRPLIETQRSLSLDEVTVVLPIEPCQFLSDLLTDENCNWDEIANFVNVCVSIAASGRMLGFCSTYHHFVFERSGMNGQISGGRIDHGS